MRTRAMASLRRPVPDACPVMIGRRATRPAGPASTDSVVYSDGASSSEISSPASGSLLKYSASSADGVSVPVDSATLLFLTLPCGARLPDILRACPSDRHPGIWRSHPGRLLRNLADLVRLRLLRLVRVIRTRVHLELGQRLAAKGVLGQHPLDRLLDHALRVLFHQVTVAHRAKPARITRVPVGTLVLKLGAAQRNLVRVHDDHEVAGVDVRGEDWLVLASQEHRHMAGQAAEHDIGGVDNMPLMR